ncbi:LOW QUALITY PROTEIN: Gag protein [Phytophthora palmivora]|uniref:Gag protein n=1 Tax=Phytophthora palmivora TaxID=4796 RepID=A0A2P4YBN6_9STRA|nr:LOW QUALITY PROTEIN: Gag protein [Phytophthora palmivora]
MQTPVAEMKPAQPKPLRLKVNSYEGKEGENFHFWRLRVAFAVSNLGGRAKAWAYTREATTPDCEALLSEPAFRPTNYEYRQRSRFLACKQGKRELHEYIQEMRVLAASLVGNPLPEHIKLTVLMDGLKVGPSRTQLFRVQANTMEKAIQIALQEEYSHRQARTPTSCKELQQLELAPGRYPWNWVRPYRAPSVATDVGSSGTCNVPALREGKGSSLPNLGAREISGRNHDPPHGRSADGARHGGLAPESLGARNEKEQRRTARGTRKCLETRKSSGGLLVVHASVRGYGDPFIILIDYGASTNFARCQTVARYGDKYADALRESEGKGLDWSMFEDFDSTESFLVLDMDKYDLILGMPWLEKHEPWIFDVTNPLGLAGPQSPTELW